MSSIAIETQELCKQYKVYPSNRQRVLEWFHPLRKQYHQKFWALHPISFNVPTGGTFGILGRNGSGKSTLLQLMSGVLTPTSGSVKTYGKISALLELGTGFNPEFSGRENVILNGAILGYSRQEMEERLPLIEEFSELGDFLNFPVKTYSSGMYVRLAFSAAINVDPDILIVDEALAVGDAKFQNKCYRKFEQFRKAGKTVLLVTHDTAAVMRYCDQVLLLDGGEFINLDEPRKVVNQYTELLHSGTLSNLHPDEAKKLTPSNTNEVSDEPQLISHIGYQREEDQEDTDGPLNTFLKEHVSSDQCAARASYNPNEHRYGNRKAEVVDYFLKTPHKTDPSQIETHEMLELYIKVRFHEDVPEPIYGVTLRNLNGLEIYGNNSWFSGTPVTSRKAGDVIVIQYHVQCRVLAGDHFLSVGVAEKLPEDAEQEVEAVDRRYDLLHLKVTQSDRSFGVVDLEASFMEYQLLNKPQS